MKLNFHSNHKLLFSTIFFGFLALSAIIAIMPAVSVEAQMAPLPGSEPMTALEHDGLRVYISEGCVACHTQQVRPLAMDEVWGRAAVPGDFARLEEDGTITLLGRGSACINTAGEKVYPEEVEEVLKTYEGVLDAVARGPEEPGSLQLLHDALVLPGLCLFCPERWRAQKRHHANQLNFNSGAKDTDRYFGLWKLRCAADESLVIG